MLKTHGRWLAALAFLVASSAYTANATVVTCDSSIDGNVDSNSGCQVSDETNDAPQPGLVNDEEFFAFDDWSFDGKFEGEGNDTSVLADFTGNSGDEGTAGTEGTWSLVADDFWATYSEILFIFKDGAGTTLVGYLLTAVDGLSGTWTTPFTEPPFDLSSGDGIQEASHISVYFREGGTPPQEIPEPTSLLLLGSGLVGLGAWRRRAQRS